MTHTTICFCLFSLNVPADGSTSLDVARISCDVTTASLLSRQEAAWQIFPNSFQSVTFQAVTASSCLYDLGISELLCLPGIDCTLFASALLHLLCRVTKIGRSRSSKAWCMFALFVLPSFCEGNHGKYEQGISANSYWTGESV